MNNRIMAALFALTLCLCLFIGVVPVDAEAACSHSKLTRVEKAATCTETGLKPHYECASCDAWFPTGNAKDPMTKAVRDDQVIPALGHDFTAQRSDDTHHWNKCSRTGCQATDTKVAHTLVDDPADAYDAKCAVKCTECAKIINVDHKYELTLKDDPQSGHKEVCSVCKREQGWEAHDWNKVVEADKHTYTCKKCNYVSTTSGAHVDADKDCECDICGYEIPHAFGDEWFNLGEKHFRKCTVCGEHTDVGTCEFDTYVSNGDGTHSKVCKVCARKVETEACPVDADHICDYCKGFCHHGMTSGSMTAKVNGGAATCTTKGWVAHAKCTVCGIYVVESTGKMTDKAGIQTPELNHKFEETISWDTENHYYKCVRWNTCNEVKDSAAHTMTYTENSDGTHTAVCSGCGYKKTTKCSDIAGDNKCECVCGHKMLHSTSAMVRHSGVAPTCETAGNQGYWECTTCGSTFIVDANDVNKAVYSTPGDPTLPAKGHKWAHDEDISGKHVLKCGNCSDKQLFEHLDETGDCLCDVVYTGGRVCGTLVHAHTPVWVEGEDATCEREGFEGYWTYEDCDRKFKNDFGRTEIDAPIAIPMVDCTPGEWVNEGDEHVRYCDVCGEECESADHEDANYDNRCDVCGFELTLDFVAEVPATCTTSGTAAHYVSSVTGRSYWDAQGTQYISDTSKLTIRAFEHVDPATGLGPQGKDNGDGTHDLICLICDAVRADNVAHTTGGCFCTVCGAANGDHKSTSYEYVAPTCDKDGHEAYAKCSCGKYFNALGEETTYQALVVKALGHKWGAEIFNDDASGKHYAVCVRCNGKNYGEHKPVASDPLSGNYHQMVCECGKTTLELHYDKNGDNVCDENGCKRDLSNKKVEVNNHDSVTVVTGDKNNTNSAWSWLKNWLTNTTPSNGGGSAQPDNTAQPGTSAGSQGSTPDNDVTPPAGGSNPSQGGNQTPDATGVLQYIISFFNWVFSGFGG